MTCLEEVNVYLHGPSKRLPMLIVLVPVYSHHPFMRTRTRSRSVSGSHNIHNRNAPHVHVTIAPVAPTAGLKVLEISTMDSGAADTERDGRSTKMPRGTVDLMKGEGKFVVRCSSQIFTPICVQKHRTASHNISFLYHLPSRPAPRPVAPNLHVHDTITQFTRA